MGRDSNAGRQIAQQLIVAFIKLPLAAKVTIIILGLIVGGLIYAFNRHEGQVQTPNEEKHPQSNPSEPPQPGELENVPPPAASFPPGSKSVLFCVWNMENLFDDKEDHRKRPDEEYDEWFARDAETRKKKYQHLTEALLKLNGGIGPDIIVGNEAESHRSAELLQESLNASLPAGAARYDHVAMKELGNAGRHISPCIISRYPLDRVQLLGHSERILEAHVTINGYDLLLVAAHWTSQISDDGSRKKGGRNGYATAISEVYHNAIQANPKVDFLVCGDFNDSPESEAVYHTLHMVGDYRQVTANTQPPKLFGLLSGKSPNDFGTIYYKKPLIYDQIGVSPGMFDNQGWGYDPASVHVPTDGLIEPGAKGRHPWRFGSPKDMHSRGFSDHFPVVVTLKVAP
jgi:endonuclease/exonuclease/phosphatase family metal-dependent hydrolase